MAWRMILSENRFPLFGIMRHTGESRAEAQIRARRPDHSGAALPDQRLARGNIYGYGEARRRRKARFPRLRLMH
jgi:hypothetical protein